MSSRLPLAVAIAGLAVSAAPAEIHAASRCSYSGFTLPPLAPIAGNAPTPPAPASPPVAEAPPQSPAPPAPVPPTTTAQAPDVSAPPAGAPPATGAAGSAGASPPPADSAPAPSADNAPPPSGTRSVGGPSAPEPAPTTAPPAAAQPPVAAPIPASVSPGFAYFAPGDLLAQDAERARKGDRFVYLKSIVFPLKLGDGIQPHMNSQIWGHGGGGWASTKGPGGSECDAANYDAMVQRDNYCEVRDHDSTHAMPLCPKGYGHQGQDIRPPACPPPFVWQAVAVADGTIETVTGFSYMTLKGKDGTVYAYLHMDPKSVKVKKGDKVKQGAVLGNVANVMDYESGGTTYHLHFQVKQQIKVGAKTLSVYVPVYASLIAALRRSKGLDPGIDTAGNLMVDPSLEIGAVAMAPPPTATAPLPETRPAAQ